ncbi:hypothetical protein ABBQ38_005089 [Trebouxia sp. C0009 RCD-2024]
MAEVQAAKCNWTAVIEHTLPVAELSTTSGDSLAAKMQLEASLVCVRALLTSGHDADAVGFAKQAAKQVETWFPDDAQSQARQQAQLEANTSLLAALHATGDLKAAASIAEGVTESASRLARKTANKIPDACVTAAHAQAIAIRLATAAQTPPEELAGGTDSNQHVLRTHVSGEQSSTDLRPAHWQQAVAAHYLVMDAQAAAAQQQWNRAEEQLAKALNLAEQLNSANSQSPQVGLVLGMLGHTYARSKRITLAEGLHRQAVKLMKLDPECGSSSRDALLIHGSLASCAAWRYAQLLHALPKRNTEASAWQEFAARHWQATDGPSRNTELEKVLGPLDILKGGTDDSPGMIVDLMLLRGLPCC